MGFYLKGLGKTLASENDPLLGKTFLSKQKWFRLRNVFILLLLIIFVFVIIQYCFYTTPTEEKQPMALKSVSTINNDYFNKCAPIVKCDSKSKYRTVNGSCNNLQNPTWGAALTPFYRYMDPEFRDGISKFRLQSDGTVLPNARHITLTLFQNKTRNSFDLKHNELLVPWGQFVTHDMAYSEINSVNSSFPAALDHCQDENPPAECEAAIRLYPDDPVYGKYNLSLLKFMRLVTSANFSCPLTPSTILNQNTHFIDGSNVYGSDDKTAADLRLFNGGKLAYQTIGKENYCPQDTTKNIKVGNKTEKQIAFLAGDVNVNQNLGIALIQNLFLRFHNYIADKLQDDHPTWTDETVYQETRRIVAAVIQIITYDQYLPVILGEQYMDEYGLNRETNYDPTITVAMAQEMSSGALRMFHSMIPAQFNYVSKNYTIYEVEKPSESFLRPDSMIGNVDGFIRGMMETPERAQRPEYNHLISNIVIKSPLIKTTGFDLQSYDVQRGRDVGLPPYTKMRTFCGSTEVKSFDDLSDHIPLDKIEQLKSLYASVDDIDYHVGILLENRVKGSMVGPTGSCVIADCFRRMRNGDRFFYDVQGQPGSFTSDQIRSLRKITLSHLICATSQVDHVQMNTFRLVDHIRLMKLKPNCTTYKIDLTAW